MEYKLIERILLDTRTLRNDEMNILLEHLISNTSSLSNAIIKKETIVFI